MKNLFSTTAVRGLVALLFVTTGFASSANFSYTIPEDSQTSAGIYKEDGTLVRTLWNNEFRSAGDYAHTWDGFDDTLNPSPSDQYEVNILTHNVDYVWEGYIGNTTTNQTGTTTQRAHYPYRDMAITANNIYPLYGYNEKRSHWSRISLSDPNAILEWGEDDFARVGTQIATDGISVYLTLQATGWGGLDNSMVVGFSVADGSQIAFASGTETWTGTQGYHWIGANYQEGVEKYPTGLAVQKNGPYLFVAHGSENLIRVIDKTSGSFITSFTITNPSHLATDSSGDLWITCIESGSQVVRRYEVDGSGTLSASNVAISGLNDIWAIEVSPDDSIVALVLGGDTQQVKAFDNVSSGTPSLIWTLGTLGGYNQTNGPNVTPYKFCFADEKTSFIRFQNDGSFWLGDAGNERYLKFNSSRVYQDQIAFISVFYTSAVCEGDPTRVFARWLEFEVDYSEPIESSWTLVKNWSAGLPESYLEGNNFQGFQSVTTLSNGRVYAVAARDSSINHKMILELPTAGTARVTGVTIDNKTLHRDGSLRWQELEATRAKFFRQNLTGFDGSGNPLFSSVEVIATAPRTAIDPVNQSFVGPKGYQFPTTSSGVMIASNTSGATWHYYLGGVKEGTDEWLWRAAPHGVYFDDRGTVGDSQYPANVHHVDGKNIFFGCHGEFYQGGQANKFLHFWENGLFVGQFGADGFGNPINNNVAGRTGNAFGNSLIRYGSDLYLWVNDEWGTGVHRWKIENLESVTELAPITIQLPAMGRNGQGLTGEYYHGTDFEILKKVKTDDDIWFTFDSDPMQGVDFTNFSVRWTGYIVPDYTEDYVFYTNSDSGVRLTIANQLVIDNWTSHSSTQDSTAPISLTAGTPYPVVMEYYNDSGNGIANLKWESLSQSKWIIPRKNLIPSHALALNGGGPKIGRFLSDSGGVTQSTSNPIDRSGVSDPAPTEAYQLQREGNSGYDFMGLQPHSNYNVRLHLAETDFAKFSTGARTFKVLVNGQWYLPQNIDPFFEAGEMGDKAAVREFVATTDHSGLLALDFKWNTNYPLVAAIEVGLSDPNDSTPHFARIGRGTGLKGMYYSGTNFDTYAGTRFDKEVHFEWGYDRPHIDAPSSNYSIRWTGKIHALKDGEYSFRTKGNTGRRLWIDGILIVDAWTATGSATGSIILESDTLYEITYEYFNHTGDSNVALQWKQPGDSIFSTVPQFQLYPPASSIEVIVDNSDSSGINVVGAWTSSVSVQGYWRNNYLHDGNSSKGYKSVTFTPDLPEPGDYDVYIRYTAGPSRPEDTPVRIDYDSGSVTYSVNQRIENGRWILLGTYPFASGNAGSITIENDGTNGHVIADAVKFVR